MKIEINNRTGNKVDLNLIKRVVSKFARAYKVGAKEISMALVGDAEIKKLNQVYRGLNRPTDVLAFPGQDGFLGELVMDYDQIKRQAPKFSQSIKQELIFILVHGLLHLIGYNDETEADRREMIRQGEEFVKKLKID